MCWLWQDSIRNQIEMSRGELEWRREMDRKVGWKYRRIKWIRNGWTRYQPQLQGPGEVEERRIVNGKPGWRMEGPEKPEAGRGWRRRIDEWRIEDWGLKIEELQSGEREQMYAIYEWIYVVGAYLGWWSECSSRKGSYWVHTTTPFAPVM